ncbi:MAG: hypothetical protein ACYCSJ_06930, partial [Acidimicrobiales bacterium]
MPTDKRQRQREGRQYRRAQLEAARKRRTRMRQGGLAVAIVAVIVVLVVLTSLGGSKKTNVNASSTTSTTAATTTTAAAGIPPSAPPVTGGGTLKTWACPNPDGSSPHMAHFPSTPPPMCIDPAKTYTVNMTTNQGDITFTLDTKNTP